MARTIALVGGGTMGPTAPLLALQKVLAQRHPSDKFVWAGTENGPERGPVAALGKVEFVSIPTAKFPRYLTWAWLTVPFDFWKAKSAAKKFLDQYKPDIVIGAGGFTQVPVICEAAKRKIPCVIHQLDFLPSLSNKLVARYCKLITTTFIYHYRKFNVKVDEMHIATPNRFSSMDLPERAVAAAHFGLDPKRPIVFVTGGGTGSMAINRVIEDRLEQWLAKTQIIHVTGRGKSGEVAQTSGYVRSDFFDVKNMLNAYAAADIVVSRAGMGAITDLSTFGKAAILIPIPNSHQEKNTRHLRLSVVEVKQGENFFEDLYRATVKLLKHPEDRVRLSQELQSTIKTDDGSEWASLIERFLPDDLD